MDDFRLFLNVLIPANKIMFFCVRLDLWDTLDINPSPNAVLPKVAFIIRGRK